MATRDMDRVFVDDLLLRCIYLLGKKLHLRGTRLPRHFPLWMESVRNFT